jgi:hypothetical protein
MTATTPKATISTKVGRLMRQRAELQQIYHFGEGRVAGLKKPCCSLPGRACINVTHVNYNNNGVGPLANRSPVQTTYVRTAK